MTIAGVCNFPRKYGVSDNEWTVNYAISNGNDCRQRVGQNDGGARRFFSVVPLCLFVNGAGEPPKRLVVGGGVRHEVPTIGRGHSGRQAKRVGR